MYGFWVWFYNKGKFLGVLRYIKVSSGNIRVLIVKRVVYWDKVKNLCMHRRWVQVYLI